MTGRVDLGSFEHLYRGDADPWSFATSAYELGRYDRIVQAAGARAHRRCFEPACSIGVLTERLTTVADEVVACDASPTAIAAARARLDGRAGVELVAEPIPEWWPAGGFDLVVLSELGYYWDIPGWAEIVERVAGSLEPTADLVAVHWLGSSADHILNGREVHAVLRDRFGDPHQSAEIHDSPADVERAFVLDHWAFG